MFKFSFNRLRHSLSGASNEPEREQLYLAPPFTEDVVKAVRLISTCLPLKANEQSRVAWQQEGNDASLMEYDALLPLFSSLPKPKKVLDVGAGLGRSVVVFGKKHVWDDDATIHLYDTDGSETKYKQKHYDQPPQWPDVSSFCGNLSLLDTILKFNGVKNYQIFDAAKLPLNALPGPYDLIYGFYSVGFHWSLDYYLDDIAPLMNEKSVLVCTLNKHFTPFPRLGSYSTRILQAKGVKKGARPLSYLAVSKSPLPEVGLSLKEAFGT